MFHPNWKKVHSFVSFGTCDCTGWLVNVCTLCFRQPCRFLPSLQWPFLSKLNFHNKLDEILLRGGVSWNMASSWWADATRSCIYWWMIGKKLHYQTRFILYLSNIPSELIIGTSSIIPCAIINLSNGSLWWKYSLLTWSVCLKLIFSILKPFSSMSLINFSNRNFQLHFIKTKLNSNSPKWGNGNKTFIVGIFNVLFCDWREFRIIFFNAGVDWFFVTFGEIHIPWPAGYISDK